MSLCACFKCFKRTHEAPEVVKIDYSHRSLVEVPPDIFLSERTLESLVLASNQIPDLPPNLFHCHELKVLDLSDNELSVIPAAIGSLTRLTNVDLSRNAITEVSDSIKNCKNMVTLDLSVNQLVKVPEGISQLVNLEQLLLNDTCLEFLHANVGRLTKIRALELRENQLQTLPKSLTRLTHLTRLDLSANDLPDIPEVIGTMTSLTELWVEGNSVRRIPQFIGNLTKLTCLDVANNDVREISEEISKCSQLVDLTLCINSLDSLPDSFPKLENLSVLRLDSNQIEYLPEDFGNMKNLTEFSLLHNLLKAVPPSIGLLRKLHTLYLDDNLLRALPKELGSCSSLTVLHVAKNRLTEIPSEFGHLSKLKVLELSGNLITHLPVSLLNITSLGAVWLSEGQCKPMLQFNNEIDSATGQNVLTCYLLPQMPSAPISTIATDDEPTPRIVRPSSRSIKFANDPESTVMDSSMKKGLLRAPTPYPKELRAMAKQASHFRQNAQNGDVMSPDEPEYEGDYIDQDGVHLGDPTMGSDEDVAHGLKRRVGGLLDISALDSETPLLKTITPRSWVGDSRSEDNGGADKAGADRKPDAEAYRYRHPLHANYHEDVIKQNMERIESELKNHLDGSCASQEDQLGPSQYSDGGAGDSFDVNTILDRIEATNKRSLDDTYSRHEGNQPESQRLLDLTTQSDVSLSISATEPHDPSKKIPPPYHVAARRAAFFRTPSHDRPPSVSSSRGSDSGTIIGESKYTHLPGLTTQFSSVASFLPSVTTIASGNAALSPSTTSALSHNYLSRLNNSEESDTKRHQSPLPPPAGGGGLNTTFIIKSEHSEDGDCSENDKNNMAGPNEFNLTHLHGSDSDNRLLKESVSKITSQSTVSANMDVLNSMTNTISSVTTKTRNLEELHTPTMLSSKIQPISAQLEHFTKSPPQAAPESNQVIDSAQQHGNGLTSPGSSSGTHPVLGSSESKVSILDYEKSPNKYSSDVVQHAASMSNEENGSSNSGDPVIHQPTTMSRIPKHPSSYTNLSLKTTQSSTTLPTTTTSSSALSNNTTSSKIPYLSHKPVPPKPANSSAAHTPSSIETSRKIITDPSYTEQPSITASKIGLGISPPKQPVKSTTKIPSITAPLNNSFRRTGSGSRIQVKKVSLTEESDERTETPPSLPLSKIPTLGSGGRKPWIFGAHKNLRVVALDYRKIKELGFTICNGVPGDTAADKTGVYVDSVEAAEDSAVKIGDKILQVDGIDISNMTLEIVRKVLSNCQANINLMVSRQT